MIVSVVPTNVCSFFSFSSSCFLFCATWISNFTLNVFKVSVLTECVYMRFELCHPPKHFIPKMKIYKNDCRQTSCAFFLSSNQKECVFLLNSLSFHHHFAFFFSLSICINLLLVFFDRTKSERENIQNDTKYYTIDEKERKKRRNEKCTDVHFLWDCVRCSEPSLTPSH